MGKLNKIAVHDAELTERQVEMLAKLHMRGSIGTGEDGAVLHKLKEMGLVYSCTGQHTNTKYLLWLVAPGQRAHRVAQAAAVWQRNQWRAAERIKAE